MDHDLEMRRYLFDLAGYLVIPDLLGRAEVDELNRLIDAQGLPPPHEKIRFGAAAGGAPECPGFLDWGKPFCDLLDHPRIMPLLQLTLGDWFRLDRLYGINMETGMGAHQLHGGNAPYSPAEYYHVRNGRIHNAFTVVSWNLVDTGPDHGGFCCVPGSHKSNFPGPHPDGKPGTLGDVGRRLPCSRRRDSGGAGGIGSAVLGSVDAWHGALEGPPPAPHAALQVLPVAPRLVGAPRAPAGLGTALPTAADPVPGAGQPRHLDHFAVPGNRSRSGLMQEVQEEAAKRYAGGGKPNGGSCL